MKSGRRMTHTAVRKPTLCTQDALAPVLDEMTRRGVHVGQSDRLGDTAINEANATTRHNAVNRCIYNARAAVATSTVRLGDKQVKQDRPT